MSQWQLKSDLDVLRTLPLKFGQNLVSNGCDIADIEFVGWVVVVGGGGEWWLWVVVKSHFHVDPNLF